MTKKKDEIDIFLKEHGRKEVLAKFSKQEIMLQLSAWDIAEHYNIRDLTMAMGIEKFLEAYTLPEIIVYVQDKEEIAKALSEVYDRLELTGLYFNAFKQCKEI